MTPWIVAYCFSVLGISQERLQEWVAISLSRDLPDPGIEPVPPAFAGGFFTTKPSCKPLYVYIHICSFQMLFHYRLLQDIEIQCPVLCSRSLLLFYSFNYFNIASYPTWLVLTGDWTGGSWLLPMLTHAGQTEFLVTDQQWRLNCIPRQLNCI